MKWLIILLTIPLATSLSAQKVQRTLIQNDERIELSYLHECRQKIAPDAWCYWVEASVLHSAQGASPISGRLDGEFKRFNNQGNLIEEGEFKHGMKTGIWKKWNTAGVLQRTEQFREGVYHGLVSYFDQDGKPISTERYSKGELHGTTTIFQPDGSIIETKYKRGEVVVRPSKHVLRLPRKKPAVEEQENNQE